MSADFLFVSLPKGVKTGEIYEMMTIQNGVKCITQRKFYE
jgi:hypothetical protein